MLLCIIYLNTVKITEKQQEVCGIITEINQVILHLLILNLLNIKPALQENYNVGDDEEGYDVNKVGKNETEVVIPLKLLSNVWRFLILPLINCEVELILTWSQNCVLAMTVNALANPATVAPTKLKFEITDTKLCVPVVI